MKRLLLALLLMSTTAGSQQAPQHKIVGRMLGRAETMALMLQAVQYSRYPMPTELPVVDVIPDAVWVAAMCPEEASEDCTLLGYYSVGEDPGVVRVRDTRPEANRPYQGVVVHEMVHYLQRQAGWVPHNCSDVAAHEMEAYAVEYVNDLAQGRVRAFEMSPILGMCLSQTK